MLADGAFGPLKQVYNYNFYYTNIASFPPSGTGQYSTVRFGTEHHDPACVSTANSNFYLIGAVVSACRKVVIDDKAQQ